MKTTYYTMNNKKTQLKKPINFFLFLYNNMILILKIKKTLIIMVNFFYKNNAVWKSYGHFKRMVELTCALHVERES